MKLSKKVWLIVIVIILAVVLGSLFALYSRQAGERDQLNDSLDRAQTLLPGLAANKESLEDQLAEAQSSLDTNRTKYPESVESIEYGEYLFEIADRCDLTLDSLNFPKPTGGQVSLSLPVSGAVNDIFEFIDIIRTDARFASTQVKSVNLNVEGGKATISVTIYSYQG